jgi:ribonuclease VapC
LIAVDTSALLAVFLGAEMKTAFRAVLAAEERLLIASGTVAELPVVAARRGTMNEMLDVIDSLPLDIISVPAEAARRMGLASA